MSRLLSVPEAAAYLAVKENTVYRLIARGDLRHVDLAVVRGTKTKTRIRLDDLEALIEARTTA